MLQPFSIPATAKNAIWYRVTVAGYEVITYPDGDNSLEFVVDSFKVEITDSYLGLNTRPQIIKEASEQFPEKFVIDYLPCKAPIEEF